MTDAPSAETQERNEVVELSYRISQSLKCSLSKKQLGLCIALLDSGVSPEALAHIVTELPNAVARRRATLLQ